MSFSSSALFTRTAPALFVVLWSSGFIVARLVAPHSTPLAFLSLRYAVAILVLAVLVWLGGVRGPRSSGEVAQPAVAGLLLHGVYLGGIFWSVKNGLPAGIAGLFSGLQPLATAALAGPLLGERVGPRRWAGIGLGFAGAVLVLAPKLGSGGDAIPPAAIGVGLLAVAGFTAGTLWQKRTGTSVDLRAVTMIQYSAALVPTLLAALLFEDVRLDPVPELALGLFWSVAGLSIGAVLLLLALIHRGAVVRVAALLYLVPPVTALMAWLAFGETLNAVQLLGMALAAIGVALASRPEPAEDAEAEPDA